MIFFKYKGKDFYIYIENLFEGIFFIYIFYIDDLLIFDNYRFLIYIYFIIEDFLITI